MLGESENYVLVRMVGKPPKSVLHALDCFGLLKCQGIGSHNTRSRCFLCQLRPTQGSEGCAHHVRCTQVFVHIACNRCRTALNLPK